MRHRDGKGWIMPNIRSGLIRILKDLQILRKTPGNLQTAGGILAG
jgi:hypothetical protein